MINVMDLERWIWTFSFTDPAFSTRMISVFRIPDFT
jgi:hypothetical protein